MRVFELRSLGCLSPRAEVSKLYQLYNAAQIHRLHDFQQCVYCTITKQEI
jgi:hypothetical protein